MTIASIDIETRSDVDIGLGIYNYSTSPHFKILIICYKIDDAPIRTWTYDQPPPEDLLEHFRSGGNNAAFNSSFERLCLQEHAKRFNWPIPKLESWRCTAVASAAMSLPRSLDRVGAALGITEAKSDAGKKLIKLFSVPKSPGPVWNEPADHPKEFAEFCLYCAQDVRAEMEVAARLIPISDAEQAVYHLSERINDVGIRLDIQSARSALRLAEKARHKVNAELHAITSGAVEAVTQTARLKTWLASRGVSMETVSKDDVDDFLHFDDIPEDARQALILRVEAGNIAGSKIDGMLKRASADGRMRGSYVMNGAGQTCRFSSRGAQLHNLVRYRKLFEDSHVRLDVLFDAIRTEDPDWLKFLYGPELGRPMHLLSDATRSFIWAAPGHELLIADFSSIEGRIAPWFSGEQWKIDAYAALDRGEGFGIYELAAAGIYGIDVRSVTKGERATGKIAELSMGYAGGVGALSRMARANKLKLETVFPALWEATEAGVRERVTDRYDERLGKHDATAERLGWERWAAAEIIKLGWREKHPAVVASWKAVEAAAKEAVENPGTVVRVLKAAYLVAHGFLLCRLPSGRCIAYGAPKMREVDAAWADKTLEPPKREKVLALTVRGADAQTGAWTRFPVYSGILYNNLIQSMARDILVHGMLAADKAGHKIVLHVHDEIGSEQPAGTGGVKEFENLICQLPAWTQGLPLTANGFVSKRYKKQ